MDFNFSEMLKSAIDLHVHTSPDMIERKFTDIELVRRAKMAGMYGVVLKNHFVPTTSRAKVAEEAVGGIKVFGGVVLNKSVGGLNPEAVNVAAKLGAKEIWMPTVDAFNHRNHFCGGKGGISILNKGRKLRGEVYEIIDIIAEYNIILGTGHISLQEITILVDEALKRGVQKILVTHPEWWVTMVPIGVQKELRNKGVFFERCFYASTLKGSERTSIDVTANWIKILGADSSVISSDLGQKWNIEPIKGLEVYVSKLIDAGISENDIEVMIKRNPKELLS